MCHSFCQLLRVLSPSKPASSRERQEKNRHGIGPSQPVVVIERTKGSNRLCSGLSNKVPAVDDEPQVAAVDSSTRKVTIRRIRLTFQHNSPTVAIFLSSRGTVCKHCMPPVELAGTRSTAITNLDFENVCSQNNHIFRMMTEAPLTDRASVRKSTLSKQRSLGLESGIFIVYTGAVPDDTLCKNSRRS